MRSKPVIDYAGLGALLKGFRETRGLNLRAAAEESSVSAPTLSRIERCQARPDLDTVQALVDWIGVPLERVMVRANETAAVRPRARARTEHDAVDAAEIQFRADPNLSPQAAEALIKILRAAYAQMANPVRK